MAEMSAWQSRTAYITASRKLRRQAFLFYSFWVPILGDGSAHSCSFTVSRTVNRILGGPQPSHLSLIIVKQEQADFLWSREVNTEN